MENVDEVEILLVEDNAADAELTLRALEHKHLVNRVHRVEDGEAALDFIFRRGRYAARAGAQPRLVMLDLKLPKVDGIEVLRRVKSHDATHTIPIVMLTSSAEERDIIESYNLGVNSYIVKPVDFRKFIGTVAEIGYYWMLVNKEPR
jgi:two-component system, response regulator